MSKRQLREFDEKLTDEAEALNQYLYQYRDSIRKKNTLERRREEIRKEFNHPLKGVSYDGMPHGSSVSVGSAAISYRLDEIDTKITEQITRAQKLLIDIMNIIDFLEEQEYDLSRSIIENRYIDRMGWEKIGRENHASKSKVCRYWKKGLYRLLEFKKVQNILSDYMKEREYE